MLFKNLVLFIISFLILNASAESLSLKICSADKSDTLLLTDKNERVVIKDERFAGFPAPIFRGYTIIGQGLKKNEKIYLKTIDSLIEPSLKELKKNTGIGVIKFNCCSEGNELIIYEDTLEKEIQFKMKLEWDIISEFIHNRKESQNIFKPYIFTIINGLYMKIRVIDIYNKFYKVITNEETGKTGWIKKSELDSSLVFRTWEESLKKIAFGVRPKDGNYTYFYKSQSFFSDTLIPRYGNIMPVEVEGVWLKAVEHSFDIDIENPRYFWMLWRNNRNILIDFLLEY